MYFAIRIGLMPDGTKLNSITSCDTLDDAKKKFHNDLFGYIGKCENICCMVMDWNGNTYAMETWESTNENESGEE